MVTLPLTRPTVRTRDFPDLSALRKDLVSGLITAQIAGLCMALTVMLIFTAFLGKTPNYPFQLIGSVLFGEEALLGMHVPALVAGILIHQVFLSQAWAVGFAFTMAFTGIRGGLSLVILAAAFAIVSRVIDVDLFVPLAFTAAHGRDLWNEQVAAHWSWIAHLAFGAGLLFFPRVRRTMDEA